MSTGVLHTRRALSTVCSSQNTNRQTPASHPHNGTHGLNRRALLSGALISAAAYMPALSADARSSFTEPERLCVAQTSAEDAESCRLKELQKDAASQLDYSSASTARTFNTASGVPVADMADAYSRETVALYDIILRYGTLDPYDKARPPLIKLLKTDSANWVSQYARGGSARKLSARTFYNAVDAVSGHIASNGQAPLPKNKLAKVKASMDEAMQYLKDGR